MDSDDDDAFSVLCAAIGRQATERLLAQAAGSWVYVPTAPRPGKGLTKIIGVAATAAAIEAVGRGQIYVRKVVSRAERDAEIRLARAAGRSLRCIATETGLSAAKIKEILAAARR